MTALNIFWFRRDLRLFDNAGLYHALKAGLPVLPVFVFDRNILDLLENKKDGRVEFIYDSVRSLQKELAALASSIFTFYGTPLEMFGELAGGYDIKHVFTNEDYEPSAIARDVEIEKWLKQRGIGFTTYKDQVIFSKKELLKDDGLPYAVFTPYGKKWKKLLEEREGFYLKSYPVEKYFSNLFKGPPQEIPDLSSLGFSRTGRKIPSAVIDPSLISDYAASRDFPGLDATSHLGVHLRFGTISIRRLVAEAKKLSEKFLDELIWRDFYQMILFHFPAVGSGHSFKPEYERIPWRNNEKEFELWCEGKTGYPLVDAGMRQINETGFMHNRVRMVVASFLTKHLLVDWRWGEAYFAGRLLDFEFASNNGGWQWAAGSGCDAAPYFRIFNPMIQQKKFDPEGTYINKWLPELRQPSTVNRPPIVDHAYARDRAIKVYKAALTGSK